MARILAISSFVAHGHVGLGAAVPALQALGHDVTALPTVVLSNHPAHPHVAGTRTDPALLDRMLDALAANDWLGSFDAVLTGYLPSPDHVAFAVSAVQRVRSAVPSVLVLCDPIVGDDPKGLYIDAAAAAALRDTLLPLADVATPNRFELAWLSGMPVTTIDEATASAQALQLPAVIAKSVPTGPDGLATLLVENATAWCVTTRRREAVPQGTGDFLAGLLLGHRLLRGPWRSSLGLAVAGVDAVIAASAGGAELAVGASRAAWLDAEPVPIKPITP